MLKYILRDTGSNEIINVILVEPGSSFTIPTGYATESYSATASILTSTTESNNFNKDSYFGSFTGNADFNSLKISGDDIHNVISNEKFGYLHYNQNTDFTTDKNPGNGKFKFDIPVENVWGVLKNNPTSSYTSPTKLSISLFQRKPVIGVYSSEAAETKLRDAIIDINESGIKNSFILLKDRNNELFKKLQIISSSIHNDESGSYSYAVLNIDEKYNYYNEISFYESVDSVVSQSYSGSFLYFESKSFFVPDETIFDFEIIKGADSTLTGSFSGVFTGFLAGTASNALLSVSTLNSSTIEIFESSSTWTKPSWAKTVKVVCVGGGGGGGGSVSQVYLNIQNFAYATGGGGGAGGTVSFGEFNASNLPTSSISIIVGAGGIGGSGSYDSIQSYVDDITLMGGNGGTSRFGNYVIAQGGQGGYRAVMENLDHVPGGVGRSFIAGVNSGGGPGGMGSVASNGYVILEQGFPLGTIQSPHELSAPNLPLSPIHLQYADQFPFSYLQGSNPSAVAPTGGGGGNGFVYSKENCIPGNQSGVSNGGKIVEESYDPIFGDIYTQGIAESGNPKNQFFPFYNTKVGLGGNGGISSGSISPTPGGSYGGGGGGAYAGGPSYPSEPIIGPGNIGANGGNGVVVVICES